MWSTARSRSRSTAHLVSGWRQASLGHRGDTSSVARCALRVARRRKDFNLGDTEAWRWRGRSTGISRRICHPEPGTRNAERATRNAQRATRNAQPPMWLSQLTLVNFRNFRALRLEPQPGLLLFSGPNGQGKTNLLEA